MLAVTSAEQVRGFQADLLASHLEPCAAEVIDAVSAREMLGREITLVAVLFEDVEPSVEYQINGARDFAKTLGMEVIHACNGREKTEPFMERLREIRPNANQVSAERMTVGLKLVSAISDVPDVWQFIEKSGLREAADFRFSLGLYTGISYVRATVDWAQEDQVEAWIRGVRAILEERNGHVMVDFAPVSLRSKVSAWGERKEALDVMRGIKQKFDPANILNRGRFVGGI